MSDTAPAAVQGLRLGSPEFKRNPCPVYARLRAEGPVHRARLPGGQPAWLVTRYDDVAKLLMDERFVKDRANAPRPGRSGRRPDPSGWRMLRTVPMVLAFLRFIRRLVRARRAAPRDDMVSALVQAEESGERPSEKELMAMIFLLLVAGHETTVNLIGNGTLALPGHPRRMEALRRRRGLVRRGLEALPVTFGARPPGP